jgi:putative hydrolase of the HAD superfamily
MTQYKAAIFDIGGVLTHSPVTRIVEFCQEQNIPDDIRYAIFGPDDGPWSRFERSELTREEFAAEFDRHVTPCGTTARGTFFMQWFFQGFGERPEMVAVVKHLRGQVKLGSITNNVAREEPAVRRTSGIDVQSLFDVVVESAIEGIRKPRILGAQAEIDPPRPSSGRPRQDLKGPRALGMHTIKVDHG